MGQSPGHQGGRTTEACVICGKPNPPRRVTCSDACNARARHRPRRKRGGHREIVVCAWCTRRVKSRRPGQKFCSRPCAAFHGNLVRKGLRDPLPTNACEHCGGPSAGPHCSLECWRASRGFAKDSPALEAGPEGADVLMFTEPSVTLVSASEGPSPRLARARFRLAISETHLERARVTRDRWAREVEAASEAAGLATPEKANGPEGSTPSRPL